MQCGSAQGGAGRGVDQAGQQVAAEPALSSLVEVSRHCRERKRKKEVRRGGAEAMSGLQEGRNACPSSCKFAYLQQGAARQKVAKQAGQGWIRQGKVGSGS